MKSGLILTMLLITLCGNVNAQALPTFERMYGGTAIDDVNYIEQTTDGGFIMVGTTSSIGAGSGDVYLVKTNASGDTLWARSYGGSTDDYGYGVHQTSDKGYIVASSSNSFGGGNYDAYIIKTDSNGAVIWSKIYGTTENDYAYGVQQTFDGGYIVAGIKNSVTTFDNDVYLVKTDANGDTLWTKTYGGSNHDEAYAVQQTPDSGYILVGLTTFGPGSANVYLIRTNSTGDTLWTKTYGTPDVEYGYDIQPTTGGGYIIAGHTLLGSGSWDALLIKINSTGGLLWSRTYGGASVDYAYSARQTTDKGFIIGGSTLNYGAGNYDMYLVKTDSIGDTLWTKTYGGAAEDRGYYAIQTADGGYAIAGYAVSFGAPVLDVYFVKTDANGNTECNQYNTATIVTTPNIQLTNLAAVVANPTAKVLSPATATQSGGTTRYPCGGNGTEDITTHNNTINIYPNPANEFTTLNFTGLNYNSLKVFDLMGRVIYTANVITPGFKLETQNFLSGICFVQISSDKKTVTEKLMVGH